MTLIIGLISQKGGVCKSTISRLLAREFAIEKWSVKIADTDIKQGTSFSWSSRRLQNRIYPEIPVQQYASMKGVLSDAEQYDLMIIDGAPHSSKMTKEIAEASDMVIIPTGLSLDDLEPTVLLAHELIKGGIPLERITIIFTRTGESNAELQDANAYLAHTPYFVLSEHLPEKTAYRKATDKGLAFSESPYKSLRERAQAVAQALVNRI